MEEAAATERLRPLPTKFALEMERTTGLSMIVLREAEKQRSREERDGRPTKPFSEMNFLEVVQAMSSYASRALYPEALDVEIERLASQPPPPPLSEAAKRALMEVLSIREHLQRSPNVALLDRLWALSKHRNDTVQFEALKTLLELAHPIEEMRLPGDEDPLKKLVEGTVPKGKGRGPSSN
jgi:hypothetical protein